MVERTSLPRLQELYRRYDECQARFGVLQRTSEQLIAETQERLVRVARLLGPSPPLRR